jgi:hypothetical protein
MFELYVSVERLMNALADARSTAGLRGRVS